MNAVEAGDYIDELYCLKREFGLSNLPAQNHIKTVRKAKTNIELKVAQINLFNAEGDVTVLELWNEDAIKGVKYLWTLLGDADEVLLRFKKLSSSEKGAGYKLVPPTSFMQDNFSFPVKERIIAHAPMQGQTCDLARQCKPITQPYHVQLLCDSLPIRHFTHWHRTLQEQEEDDSIDEFQKLIHDATGKTELGKRQQAEISTKPDKGFIAIKQEPEDDDDTNTKATKVNDANTMDT